MWCIKPVTSCKVCSIGHLFTFSPARFPGADEAASVVKALIASGALKAVERCNQAAEAGAGLRRDFSQGEDDLLSPAEALLW
mgnify:CR=1 FL=1